MSVLVALTWASFIMVDSVNVGVQTVEKDGGLGESRSMSTPRAYRLRQKSAGQTSRGGPASLNYIEGSVVDYEDGLQGAGFHVENPNVVSECGCGESFRT